MKIIGIGRNYVEHANELKNPLPKEPICFLMPDSALLRNNQPFFMPEFSENVHYEVEIVLKINRLGKNIDLKFAPRYYDHVAIGIDFTARDLQKKAAENGLPWSLAKGFDNACAISEFIPINTLPDRKKVNFTLDINNQRVQTGNTADMIFSFDAIISYLSKFMTLKIGDLIFTGTPAGVGAVKIGDHLKAAIEEKKLLDFYIR